MPKRMIDSSYLNSPSLDECSARAQDAFPRFILLADDFGCFEADTRRLVALGWSSRRTDVTEKDVWSWLEEYAAAGMACIWTERERRWCFLTGWFGEHGQKKRAEYDANAPRGTPGAHGSKRKTPVPPADLVAAIMAGERRAIDGKPPGTNREDEPETASDSVPARETACARQIPAAFPVVSRPVPAPAVPVAVPVAAAAGEPEQPRRLEVVDEGGGAPTPYLWPRAASFRQALTDRMARTVLFPIGGQEPKVMSSLEASLVAIPEAEAVELCRERILAAHSANRRGGGTLSYFAQVLADEAMRRQTNAETAPKRKRVVGVDALGQPIFEVQA